MWLKVLLLLLFLFVLFLISRIVESTLLLETGLLSTSIIDPLSLGVKELKRILKLRGVSYVGVLEKQELTSLVQSSGQLSEGELLESSAISADETEKEQMYSSASASSTTYFTCGSHFYEEVEDTKDSVWLLQVQPTHAELPLLDDYNWKQVRTRLKPFGIRTGVFNCNLDPKLCKKKNWFDRQLVLALPQGVHPKDNIVYESFRSSSRWSSAVQWVHDRLNSKLKIIKSESELKNVWLRFNDDSVLGTDVRVLLVLPHNLEPPLFFSSLSTKFSGRVTFGVIDRFHAGPLLEQLSHDPDDAIKTARYIIITPEGIFEYGKRVGEHFNFRRMELMLGSLQPEMNDVFVWSLITVNLLMLFNICLVYDKIWKHCVRCFWMLVKNNSFLFLSWLAILGLNRFQLAEVISNFLLKLTRSVATLETASIFRSDFIFWKCNQWFVIVVFVSMCAAHAWLRKKWFPSTVPRGDNGGDFVSVLTNLFFPPNMTLRRPGALDGDMAFEIDRLVERLAMANLWLQPALSRSDYVDELPVWRYRCTAPQVKVEDELSNESSCSCSSGGYVTASEGEGQVKRCQSSQTKHVHQSKVRSGECCVHSIGDTTPYGVYRNIVHLIKKFSAKCKCVMKTLRSKRRADSVRKPGKSPPAGMMVCCECAICLEAYRNNELICGLPCGHNYHQRCILGWIMRDHHQCPSCRFPTYRK